MQKDGKDLVLLLSIVLLFVSVMGFFGFLPPNLTISGVTIFLNRLIIVFFIVGIGGIIYYVWGR